MTTSMIRSKGSRLLSSSRPTTRVRTKTRKKTTVARRTRSMAAPLRERRQGSRDGGQRRCLGVELHARVRAADVRRVRLQLDPDLELVARLELVVAEDHPAVAAGLALR